MLTRKKYLVLKTKKLSVAGLTDTRDRFVEFLKMSRVLGLTPVLPDLRLAAHHSEKRNCLLQHYIEVPGFVVRSVPWFTPWWEIRRWNPTAGWLPDDSLMKQHAREIADLDIPIEWNNRCQDVGRKVVSQMDKPICCVHVRRTDYLRIRPSLLQSTAPSHIAKVLERVRSRRPFRSVYIMSSEPDPRFFDSLRDSCDLRQDGDFTELHGLRLSDNYELYAIENCIRDLCDVRVSTFDTTNADPCYLPRRDPHYFEDHLDSTPGYQ